MSNLVTVQRRLDALRSQWARAHQAFVRSSNDSTDDAYNSVRASVKSVLADNCTLIREACESGNLSKEDIAILVEKASAVENVVVDAVYSSQDTIYDFIPPFCGKVSEDTGVTPFIHAAQNIPDLLKFLSSFEARVGPGQPQSAWKGLFEAETRRDMAADIYDRSSVPSAAHTTKIAHFRPPVSVPAGASETLRAVYEARLEATSDSIVNPVSLAIAADTLVLLGRGGFKEMEPVVNLWDCAATASPGASIDDMGGKSFSPGLADTASDMAVDGRLQLVFVADDYRVKSYSLTSTIPARPDRPYRRLDPLPVHTLDSSCRGPLAVIGTRIVRAGSRGLEFWDIDSLPTHGADGFDLVGEELDLEWLETRREEHELELSTGTPCQTTVRLADSAKGYIEAWAQRPYSESGMICAWGGEWSDHAAYACVTLDVETGQLVERWLGHGGKVHRVRTNATLPNYFVTSTGDGTTRLYDVRVPVPVFAAHTVDEHVWESLLLDVDGRPYIANAGMDTHSVRLWDVTAQRCMYELSTGNNEVHAMAWDAPHHTLYAATECDFRDRLGYWHNYRRYKMPPWEREERLAAGTMNDVQGDEELEDADYEGRCWPKRSFRGEDYFGYAFDSGEHRLLRYAFKHDADINVVPPYGEATMADDYRGYNY